MARKLALDSYFDRAQTWLESLNQKKDELLFLLVKPRWPRGITPNMLTVGRIVIGLVLSFALFALNNDSIRVIMPLFLVGAATDLFDGVVARGLHMETKWGEVMDPIADRVLILPVAFYSLLGQPALLFSLIISEILNALVSLVARGKEIFFGSNIFGKTKMVIQSLVFLGILITWPHAPNIAFVELLWLSIILIAASIASKTTRVWTYYQEKWNHKNHQYSNQSD